MAACPHIWNTIFWC